MRIVVSKIWKRARSSRTATRHLWRRHLHPHQHIKSRRLDPHRHTLHQQSSRSWLSKQNDHRDTTIGDHDQTIDRQAQDHRIVTITQDHDHLTHKDVDHEAAVAHDRRHCRSIVMLVVASNRRADCRDAPALHSRRPSRCRYVVISSRPNRRRPLHSVAATTHIVDLPLDIHVDRRLTRHPTRQLSAHRRCRARETTSRPPPPICAPSTYQSDDTVYRAARAIPTRRAAFDMPTRLDTKSTTSLRSAKKTSRRHIESTLSSVRPNDDHLLRAPQCQHHRQVTGTRP